MNVSLKTLGVFLVSLFLPACAINNVFAQCTLYVAPSPLGNDANAGTITAPLATPQRAVQIATNGASVCLRAGVYQITSTIQIGRPLTLKAYPGEAVRLSAGVLESDPASVILVGANKVTIRDLEITGGSFYGIKITTDLGNPPPEFVRIQRCKIHDTGRDAIKAYMADSLLVEDSEIYNTGKRDASNAEGIDIMASIPAAGDPANRGVIIRRNFVHHTATPAVQLKAGVQRGLVEGNRIANTVSGGINIGGGSLPEFMRNGGQYECVDCIARNNVISDTRGYGLGCMAAWNPRFENNTLINVAIASQAGFFSSAYGSVGCANISFKNNVITMSSSRPMVHLVKSSGTFVSDNNDFYSTTGNYSFWREGTGQNGYWNFAGWQQNTGSDLRSFTKDPLLNSNNLYLPVAGSPVIDAGAAISGLTKDYSGVARPQGGAYDMGAHELLVSPTP
jgi:hypothetical protein